MSVSLSFSRFNDFIIASFASSLTILLRYAATNSFNWGAYAIHTTAFMFSFVMIGLLATDLAFTLKNRSNNDIKKQKKFDGFMNILWFGVYWGNLFFGSFVVKFYQYYWMSGHFSVSSKVKFALKRLLLLLIIGLCCLSGLVALCIWLYKERFIETCYTAILIMSNAYGTLLLVILLSYGLIFSPFAIWKSSSN